MNNNLKKAQYNLPTIDDMFNFYTTGVKVWTEDYHNREKQKQNYRQKCIYKTKVQIDENSLICTFEI